MSDLPSGATQEPVGFFDSRYIGTDYTCPECASTFAEFYSVNYCPVCKEHVKGRTTSESESLSSFVSDNGEGAE